MTSQFHTVLIYLYLADPATLVASNSVLGILFCSVIYWKNNYF